MNILLKVVLVLHIAAGALALATGTMAVSTRKGSRIHRVAGKIFYICMYGVVIPAFFIAAYKGNRFLLMIGVFAFYQAFAGYRAIKQKELIPSDADRAVWLLA